MKGEIKPNAIPSSSYLLKVVGLAPIVFTSIGALESELRTMELPDDTMVSTGRVKPGETEVVVPAHHDVDVVVMNLWFEEGQAPMSPVYKKSATLEFRPATYDTSSAAGQAGVRRWLIKGAFVKKAATPEGDETSDDMATQTFTLSYDAVTLIG